MSACYRPDGTRADVSPESLPLPLLSSQPAPRRLTLLKRQRLRQRLAKVQRRIDRLNGGRGPHPGRDDGHPFIVEATRIRLALSWDQIVEDDDG